MTMTTTLIHTVRIFDGHSILTQDGSILFTNSTISQIYLSNPSPQPFADEIINGEGHTVMPGMIDAHVHIYKGEVELKQCLQFGLTTVLDMFNEPEFVQETKRLVAERGDLADFRSCVHAATVEGGWPAPVIMAIAEDKEAAAKKIKSWPKLAHPDDAEAFVVSNVEKGASYIKLMQESCTAIFGTPIPIPSPALQASIVSSAHSNSLITLAHALTQAETLLALQAGVDGLAHCFCDQLPSPELIETYKKNNSFLIPTLALITSMTGAEEESSREFGGMGLSKRVLDEESKSCFCKRSLLASEGCTVEFAYETVRALKEAGLDIVAGTDTATNLAGTAFGLSFHQELFLYVERCGFSPTEALRSATSVTARRFKMDDRGVLKEGLRADVLMVQGDPTEDIGCTMNLVGIWRGGQALDLGEHV